MMRIRLSVGFTAAAVLAGASLTAGGAAPFRPSFMPQTPAFQRGIIPHTLTLAEVQQLHPTVLPEQVYQNDLRWMQTHPYVPEVMHDKNDLKLGANGWLMDDTGYIFAFGTRRDPRGTEILSVIKDCKGPEGGIVDQNENLVVAC